MGGCAGGCDEDEGDPYHGLEIVHLLYEDHLPRKHNSRLNSSGPAATQLFRCRSADVVSGIPPDVVWAFHPKAKPSGNGLQAPVRRPTTLSTVRRAPPEKGKRQSLNKTANGRPRRNKKLAQKAYHYSVVHTYCKMQNAEIPRQ